MEKRTVKKRIFLSNALMVIVTLVIFLIINLFVVKFYAESIEEEFRTSMEGVTDPERSKNDTAGGMDEFSQK